MSIFGRALRAFAPAYMRGPNGGILLDACGRAFDAMGQRFRDGRDASSVADCAPEVLPYHARDRGIRLYSEEPLASKRERLSKWHQLHRRRGTHRGELEHLQPYFLPATLPTLRIVHQAGAGALATWHKLDSAGVYSRHRATNWNYDGQDSKWSRWWTIIYPGEAGYAAPNTYDDGHTYDDGAVYDGMSTAQIDDIVDALRDWKSARSRLAAVIVAWDSASFDPTGTPVQDAEGWWSLPNGKWGLAADPTTGLGTRPPSAEWIYEDRG